MSRTFRVGPRISRSDTPLDAAVTIAPADDVHRSLVADLNAVIRSMSGRELPVRCPEEVMETGGLRVNGSGRSHPLILLGNINSNRALLVKCVLPPEDRGRLEGYLEGFHRYIRLVCSSFRDDNDHLYSFDSAENACRYALESGDTIFFDNGLADLAFRRGVMHLSNAGFYAGVGGYGEAFPGQMWAAPGLGPLLQMMAYVKRDGRCRWVYENLPNTDRAWRPYTLFGIYTFAIADEIPATAPADFLGTTELPFSPYTYQVATTYDLLQQVTHEDQDGHSIYTYPQTTTPDLLPGHTPTSTDRQWRPGRAAVTTTPLPHDRTMEKVCFREGFGVDDQYLLLQTYIGSSLNTTDANAITHFSERGKVFLFHNTSVEGMYTKNVVYVSDGQDTDPIPCACERVAVADLPGFGLSATELAPYKGTAWLRTILWRRGEYFIVLDRVRALRAGQYVCNATWRSFYRADLDGRAWKAEADGDVFYLKSGSDRPCATEHAGLEGAARPYVLRQSSPLIRDAQIGDVDGFHNLIYLSGPARERDLEIMTISPFAAVVLGQDRRGKACILYGCESGGGDVLPNRLRVEAVAFAVSETEVALASGQSVMVDQETFLALSAPVDVELDLRAGRGTVIAPTGTTITSERLGLSLTLPAGRHEISFSPANIYGLSKALALASRKDRRQKTEGRKQKPQPLHLSTVWRYDGLVLDGGPVEGVSVSVNRPPEEYRPIRLLAEPQHPNDSLTWSSGEPVVITMRLPRDMRITRIVVRKPRVARTHPKSSPVAMSDHLECKVSLLRDGQEDRSWLAHVALNPTQSSPVYGGEPWYFMEGILPVGGKPVRQIGLTFLADPMLMLGNFTLYAKATDAGEPLKAYVADVDGDGYAEILLSHTDKGRLLALIDHDGQELWQKAYLSDITFATSADLEGEGRHTILVLTAEEKLYAYRPDGGLAFETVFAGLREQTRGNGFFYGEMPWGIAPFRPDASGKRGLIAGHYCFASFLDSAGKVYDYTWVNGTYVSDPVTDRIDWDGDGQMDILFRQRLAWQGDVPIAMFDGGTRRAISYSHKVDHFDIPATGLWNPGVAHNHSIGGDAILNCIIKWGGDGHPDLVTATDKGASCFDCAEKATRWIYQSPCPVRGVAFSDTEGDGKPELLLARRDGYVIALTPDGQSRLLHRAFEEIVGFAALDRPQGLRYAIATRGSLRLYGRTWQPVGETARLIRRIETVPAAEEDLLLIHALDGSVELVSIQD